MKRKVYEFNYDQSPNKCASVYKTDAGKWQKEKCQSKYKDSGIGIPLFAVKKNNVDNWIKNQIKHIDKTLEDLYPDNKDQGIFVIKQKSQFKNEMKVAVFGAPGFGDKPFRIS